MNNINLTPVQLAIQSFGGVRRLAKAIDRDPAAVSRWQRNGIVPSAAQRQLLETAWERGIEITAHDIIFGRQA
jgi:hypothetical protein